MFYILCMECIYCVLRVRVPMKSIFHDKKFAYFDFGVRRTPKILITFFGVPPKILKKMKVLPPPQKARTAVLGAAEQQRQKLFPTPGKEAKSPLCSKTCAEPLWKLLKFWGYPCPQNHKYATLLGRIASPVTNGEHYYNLIGTILQWIGHMS